MFILTGSRAADFHGLKLRGNIQIVDYDVRGLRKDYDKFKALIINNDIFFEKESLKDPGKFTIVRSDGLRFEYDGTDSLSTLKLMDLVSKVHEFSLHQENNMFVMPLHLLYLVKRSHANYPIKFDKTISDLIKLKKFDKINLTPDEEQFYHLMRQETFARYGNLRLNVRFNPPRNPFYGKPTQLPGLDRDAMQLLYSFTHDPESKRLKFDFVTGSFDKDLFNKLELSEQLNLMRTEAMVIGTEAFHIPSNGTMSPRFVYLHGLKKLILNACRGWAQDFVLDHIDQLIDPRMPFIDRYKQAVARQARESPESGL